MSDFQSELMEAQAHLCTIPGYDPTYEVMYYNRWSDYEESGWLAILAKGDSLFEIRGGYSVMGEGDQADTWDLDPITQDEAMEQIFFFEEACESVERRMA